MKASTPLFIFSQMVLVKVSWAAVALQLLEKHPDFPNQCYLPDTNEVFDIGASWQMKDQCGQMYCQMMGDNLFVSHATCGRIHIDSSLNCVLKSDMSKPYPDCCPQPICSDDTNDVDTENKVDRMDVMFQHAERLAEQDNDVVIEANQNSNEEPAYYSDYAIQEAPILDDKQEPANYDTSLGDEALFIPITNEQEIRPSQTFMESFPNWFHTNGDLLALPRK
ncbi:hypothetical protein TCAL_11523 [Tigriopus californicus]|uniref:Single domain-containing protein n=1 Tax=Tigriopus californicus TaxID=6832 RepID=A0A553P7H4_TIGCA|nr:uncharacterized protein LOC131877883 [Tigriopus californicus]TRY73590.1 hypothetical protein TCAL_11523 [Tigriopus californicus]|eukprot:TCALIF_11523-PA protein Name:"Protein of unknown function" AED:0.00 eAED:0.00 QI:196/1/1/1/0.33/0.5/4/148/221